MQYYLTYILERGLNTPAFIRKVRLASAANDSPEPESEDTP